MKKATQMGKEIDIMKNEKIEDIWIGYGKIWEWPYSCFQHFADKPCKNVVYVFIISYMI